MGSWRPDLRHETPQTSTPFISRVYKAECGGDLTSISCAQKQISPWRALAALGLAHPAA